MNVSARLDRLERATQRGDGRQGEALKTYIAVSARDGLPAWRGPDSWPGELGSGYVVLDSWAEVGVIDERQC